MEGRFRVPRDGGNTSMRHNFGVPRTLTLRSGEPGWEYQIKRNSVSYDNEIMVEPFIPYVKELALYPHLRI